MSESDTMFNERDRKCTAVQLTLSTDPRYDNRTIASTLKMQTRTVQRLRAQPLEVVKRKATSCHLTSSKSAWKSTPKCTWMCWRVWGSPGAIRWPVAWEVPVVFGRCPWCNGYRRRKWTRWLEFKSWTRLIAFHIALIPLGKVWIQLFSLQLWVNSRTDWFL